MTDGELRTQEQFLTNDYSVELTLLGSDFDPVRASEILGLDPSKTALKGESRENGKSGGIWQESYWTHEVNSRDDVTECRDHHLRCLLDEVEPKVQELRSAGVDRICFYFTLSSQIGLLNLRLKSDLMKRLAEIGADLYISCFDAFNPSHPYWKVDGNITNGSN